MAEILVPGNHPVPVVATETRKPDTTDSLDELADLTPAPSGKDATGQIVAGIRKDESSVQARYDCCAFSPVDVHSAEEQFQRIVAFLDTRSDPQPAVAPP